MDGNSNLIFNPTPHCIYLFIYVYINVFIYVFILYTVFIVFLQKTPQSLWLDGPHSFGDEIKQLGERFRIPLICLDDVSEVLPVKINTAIGSYVREQNLLQDLKKNYELLWHCLPSVRNIKKNNLIIFKYFNFLQIGTRKFRFKELLQ